MSLVDGCLVELGVGLWFWIEVEVGKGGKKRKRRDDSDDNRTSKKGKGGWEECKLEMVGWLWITSGGVVEGGKREREERFQSGREIWFK